VETKTNDGIIRNAPVKTTPDPGPVVLPSIFDHAPAKREFRGDLFRANVETGRWELVSMDNARIEMGVASYDELFALSICL